MKRIFRTSAFAICIVIVNGCAMLSPYTPVAEHFCTPTPSIPKPKDGSGRAESCHFSQIFERNAQNTAYFSSTSTIALAGILGLGAYKAIVASSGHQYVALAAGGGALYGTGLALYKPTREQVWMRGSAALSCIDEFYSDFDPAVGEYYYQKLIQKQRDSIKLEYLTAMFIVGLYNEQYIANVRKLASSANSILSTLQPTTEQSYSAVRSSIDETVAGIPKDNLRAKLKTEEPLSDENNEAALALSAWIYRAIEQHKKIQTENLKPQCSILNSDFVIAEFPVDGKLKLKKDSEEKYTILDGSGFFTIKKSPDSASVLARFDSSNKVRLIVIEGKAVTAEPIFVTFIDSDSGVSRTLEVTVEP